MVFHERQQKEPIFLQQKEPIFQQKERRKRHVAPTCTIDEIDKWLSPTNDVMMVPKWPKEVDNQLVSNFGLRIELDRLFGWHARSERIKVFHLPIGELPTSVLQTIHKTVIHKIKSSHFPAVVKTQPLKLVLLGDVTQGRGLGIASYVSLNFSIGTLAASTFVFPLQIEETDKMITLTHGWKNWFTFSLPFHRLPMWWIRVHSYFSTIHMQTASDVNPRLLATKTSDVSIHAIRTKYVAPILPSLMLSEQQELILRKQQWRQLWINSRLCRCLYRGHSPLIALSTTGLSTDGDGVELAQEAWTLTKKPPSGFWIGRCVPCAKLISTSSKLIVDVPTRFMREENAGKKPSHSFRPRKLPVTHMTRIYTKFQDRNRVLFQCSEGNCHLETLSTLSKDVPLMPVTVHKKIEDQQVHFSHEIFRRFRPNSGRFAGDTTAMTLDPTVRWGPFCPLRITKFWKSEPSKSRSFLLDLTRHKTQNHEDETVSRYTINSLYSKESKTNVYYRDHVVTTKNDESGHVMMMGTTDYKAQPGGGENVPATHTRTVYDDKGNIVYNNKEGVVQTNSLLPLGTKTTDGSASHAAINTKWTIGWKACKILRRSRTPQAEQKNDIQLGIGLTMPDALTALIASYVGSPQLQLRVPTEEKRVVLCSKNHIMSLYKDGQFPANYNSPEKGYYCNLCSVTHAGTLPWYHCNECQNYDVCPDCIHFALLKKESKEKEEKEKVKLGARLQHAGMDAAEATSDNQHSAKKFNPQGPDMKHLAFPHDHQDAAPPRDEWCIVKLAIPPEAQINLPVGNDYFQSRRKCRTDMAVVIDIQKVDIDNEISLIPRGVYDAISCVHTAVKTLYTYGEWCRPNGFDTGAETCSQGIHFYEENNRAAAFVEWIPGYDQYQDSTNYVPSPAPIPAAGVSAAAAAAAAAATNTNSTTQAGVSAAAVASASAASPINANTNPMTLAGAAASTNPDQSPNSANTLK